MYAIAYGLVYVAGLPATVFVLLYRRRHKLYGDGGDPFVATTRAKFGFLYEVYGPNAWYVMGWELFKLRHVVLPVQQRLTELL